MVYRLATLSLILTVSLLVACNNPQPRANDAAPLPADVPAGTGSAVPAETTAANPEVAPAVNFSIAGGIAAFCDDLTIYADGSYLFESCDRGSDSGRLPQSDRLSLRAWHENLTSFQLRTEDNPAGPDNLTTALSFSGIGETEADETQRQVIYDWISGLAVRLRPKPPQAEAAPSPPAPNPDGLCPDLSRPALMLADFESPANITLLDVDRQTTCDITLSQAPFGRVTTAGGNIYYPVGDSENKAVTVWVYKANGDQLPLDFTTVEMEEPTPFDFVVSEDGTKIAWSHTALNLEVEPPIYTNYLWQADIDGANQVTLLDGVENSDLRILAPVRFSTADGALYYALQPDFGGPIFSGRYDTLYRVPAGQAEAELVYACPPEETPLCISGMARDGSVLTVLDPDQDALLVQDRAGTTLNTIALPATDYVERVTFGPTGALAFVSAALTEPASEEEPPLPDPGYLTVLAAPYSGEARQILVDNSLSTLWGWFDDTRLVYGAIDAEGGFITAIVTLDGQVFDVSEKFAVGILR